MKALIDSVGGRKMLLGLVAVAGIVLLSLLGDLSGQDAVGAIWKVVAAVAGGIAVEDGLAKVAGNGNGGET